MLKNYKDNDKKIAKKLRNIILNKYKHVDDETEQINNQTDNRADYLGLKIIDSLIRFNQSFRLSQIGIKANMSGGVITRSGGTHDEETADLTPVKDKIDKLNNTPKKPTKKQIAEEKRNQKTAEKEKRIQKEEEDKLEKELNQFDTDNKFPSSFESLLSAYSIMENIRRNYRDLRPIFNELSVPIFNDLKDILDDSNDLISKSIKTLYKSRGKQINISSNLDDYNDKLKKIIEIFNSIYDDFNQRKQTFNTNMSGSGFFSYLNKIHKTCL